jgi:hypothetical protein
MVGFGVGYHAATPHCLTRPVLFSLLKGSCLQHQFLSSLVFGWGVKPWLFCNLMFMDCPSSTSIAQWWCTFTYLALKKYDLIP